MLGHVKDQLTRAWVDHVSTCHCHFDLTCDGVAQPIADGFAHHGRQCTLPSCHASLLSFPDSHLMVVGASCKLGGTAINNMGLTFKIWMDWRGLCGIRAPPRKLSAMVSAWHACATIECLPVEKCSMLQEVGCGRGSQHGHELTTGTLYGPEFVLHAWITVVINTLLRWLPILPSKFLAATLQQAIGLTKYLIPATACLLPTSKQASNAAPRTFAVAACATIKIERLAINSQSCVVLFATW
mmetsp:Transcript_50441/g.100411  ORF Transcript_50441/g.100411 Transcript_50441/m.100411 type:complete len:241 (-) Transcript_50441:780-1502(-)